MEHSFSQAKANGHLASPCIVHLLCLAILIHEVPGNCEGAFQQVFFDHVRDDASEGHWLILVEGSDKRPA